MTADLGESRIIMSDFSDYLERAYGKEQVRIILGYMAIQLWDDKPKVPLHIYGRDALQFHLVMTQAFPNRLKITTESNLSDVHPMAGKLTVTLDTPNYSPWAKVATMWTAMKRAAADLRPELGAYQDICAQTLLGVIRMPMAEHLYAVVPNAWAAWATLCTGSEYIGVLPDLMTDHKLAFMTQDSIDISKAELMGTTLYLPSNVDIDPVTRALIGRNVNFYDAAGEMQSRFTIPYRRDLDRLFQRFHQRSRPESLRLVPAPQPETARVDVTPEIFRVKR